MANPFVEDLMANPPKEDNKPFCERRLDYNLVSYEYNENTMKRTEHKTKAHAYVRVYNDNTLTMQNISKSAKKVVCYIYNRLCRGGVGVDEMYIAYSRLNDLEKSLISKYSLTKGLEECERLNIIRKTNMIPHYYYINPRYIFAGNRTAWLYLYSVIGKLNDSDSLSAASYPEKEKCKHEQKNK